MSVLPELQPRRCSSLGVSGEEEPASTKCSTTSQHQMAIQHLSSSSSSSKKTKREKLGLLSRRLRHCILRQVSHKQLLHFKSTVFIHNNAIAFFSSFSLKYFSAYYFL